MTVGTVEDFRAFARLLVLDTGERFELEPFQVELVADILEGGFREVWVVIGEGNGKSTLLAALGLYIVAKYPNSTTFVGSVSMGTAETLFRQASNMNFASGLDRHVRAVDGRLKLYGPARSRLEVKPSDKFTAQGAIPDWVIIDELGSMRSMALPQLYSGKLIKRGGRMVCISTSGEPSSEFEEALDRMRSEAVEVTVDGCHTRYRGEGVCLHEWRLASGLDPENIEHVKACNPLAAVTVATLAGKHSSPLMTAAHWLQMSCGIATRTRATAVDPGAWGAAAIDGADIVEGSEVCVGIDFAAQRDTCAFVCAQTLEVGHPDEAIYALSKPIILTPPRDRAGTPIPREDAEAAIVGLLERYRVRAVAIDPSSHKAGSDFEDWLARLLAGRGIPLLDTGRTRAENAAAAGMFVELLRDRRLVHPGDPDLTRHVLNAERSSGEDWYFVAPGSPVRSAKHRRGSEIDALIAATLAIRVAADPPPTVDEWMQRILPMGELWIGG